MIKLQQSQCRGNMLLLVTNAKDSEACEGIRCVTDVMSINWRTVNRNKKVLILPKIFLKSRSSLLCWMVVCLVYIIWRLINNVSNHKHSLTLDFFTQCCMSRLLLLSTLHDFVVQTRSQFSDTWVPTSGNLLAEKLMYYKHWLGADWEWTS